MSNVSIILGESGSGKTTSIRTLDPSTTGIIAVLGKAMPFKGGKGKYSVEKKNFFSTAKYDEIIGTLEFYNKNEKIKTIIIDDLFFSMSEENFSRAKEGGYNKFAEMANHFQQILFKARTLRDDVNVFVLLHPTSVQEGDLTRKEIKLVGKLVRESYTPEALCNVVLYAKPKFDEDGNVTYGFRTHVFREENVEYLAKSPDGMFETDFIDNDLQLVVDAIHKYEYGED